jgi:hypothetical protein
MLRFLSIALLTAAAQSAAAPPARDAAAERRRRVDAVRKTKGFVALWDFVEREDGARGKGRFSALQAAGDRYDFRLDAINYVRDYWGAGRAASYDDFPLLGRGPFGQAIGIRAESDPEFRPCLLVPRARLHDSGLDVKGPKRSVSMVVWMVRESGSHAVAGIWHEGTDLHSAAPAQRVERGRRQYALFTGLAANSGASAVHVSENGAASFGDKYARNLAVTPEKIPTVAAGATDAAIDAAWTAIGFVYDNARHTATAYLNGKATEYWIDNPERHPFFEWPARGWKRGEYRPPEDKPLAREVVSQTAEERIEVRRYPFTKVRVTLRRDRSGRFTQVAARELAALKVNPYWFAHDLYAPASREDGGPFTIGRVIHTGRSVGTTGYIGGVAVFGRALSPREMARLSAIGRTSASPVLRFTDVAR